MNPPYGQHRTSTDQSSQISPDNVQVQKYAERYFGSWRGSPGALPSRPVLESEVSARPSGGPLYYEEASRAGPAALHAYYRPGLPGKDSVTLDAIRCVCLMGGVDRVALHSWYT